LVEVVEDIHRHHLEEDIRLLHLEEGNPRPVEEGNHHLVVVDILLVVDNHLGILQGTLHPKLHRLLQAGIEHLPDHPKATGRMTDTKLSFQREFGRED